MSDSSERPFSAAWVILSLVLFLAVELFIGTWIGPLIVGKYVSPMFHYQVQMVMHLLSLYAGGVVVGVVSPGRRLMEPAVGAFLSVLVTFMMSLFMPNWFLHFDVFKILIGGGIGFFCALLGAWHGESMTNNLPPEVEAERTKSRRQLKAVMWEDEIEVAKRLKSLK